LKERIKVLTKEKGRCKRAL